MKPAQVLPPDHDLGFPEAGVPAEPAPRRSAEPVRVWPRPVEPEDLEPLRRRHRMLEERRSRQGRRRWLRPLFWAAAVIGLPALSVTWLMSSPRFALQEITVRIEGSAPDGPARVTEAWVRETLDGFRGTPLLRLSLADAARTLERHPWVRSTSVTKDLPQRLSVRIVEHREAALQRVGEEFYYLDDRGRHIAPADDDRPAGPPSPVGERPRPDLPVLSLAASHLDPAAGLELLRELEAVRPGWLAELVAADPPEVEILGQGDFKLRIGGLPYPLLVRAGTLQDKVPRLQEILPEVTERYGAGTVVDLRFDRRIIIQPSAGGSGPQGPATGENS